jgi:hypothetical protein
VRPQIHQLNTGRQLIHDQTTGRPREHNLTTVRHGTQSSTAIDRRAEVIPLLPQLSLSRVRRNAHLQRRTLWSPLTAKSTLNIQRRSHRIRRASKRRHNTVTLTLLLRPHSLHRDRRIQQLIMPTNRYSHRLRRGLPHAELRVSHQVGLLSVQQPYFVDVEELLTDSRPSRDVPPDSLWTICGPQLQQPQRLPAT